MRPALFVGVLALAACGDDGGSPGAGDAGIDSSVIDGSTDAAIDAPAGAFTLTSPTIMMGMPFPVAHMCDGANTSPALNWSNPPAGTLSFAVIFTDNTNSLIHSIIYDIPATLTALPADVDKVYAPPDVPGAHQTTAFPQQNPPRGYLGPCPSVADGAHTYEFALYALNVATLPGATMGTTRVQARTAILANMISTVSLIGTADR